MQNRNKNRKTKTEMQNDYALISILNAHVNDLYIYIQLLNI